MGKSIIQAEDDRTCFLCGRVTGVERHHVMAGMADKKISEKYGLWVWLCRNCHTGRDGVQYNAKKALQLIKDAEMAFIRIYGKPLWMMRFRKNYLDDYWEDENDGEG